MDSDLGSVPMANPSLSVDEIIEILTWLPIVSLLRFKTVCKEWKDVIESEPFKLKHYARSVDCVVGTRQLERPGLELELMIRDIYQCLGIYNYGMILERGIFRQKYRIMNPAVRQAIELPNPQDGVFGMFLSHLPSPGDFKLISLYDNGRGTGTVTVSGCEILSLDGSANASWRMLTSFPNLSELIRGRLFNTKFVAIGVVVHCILIVDNFSELRIHILSIDIEKEDFLGIINPNARVPNMMLIEPMVYNGELGFVQIAENAIQVYSLVDCKDFVQKVVFPLNFLTRSPQMENNVLVLFGVRGSEIWLNCGGRELVFYDTALGRITSKKNLVQLDRYAFPLKPSLFVIKGMVPTQITASRFIL